MKHRPIRLRKLSNSFIVIFSIMAALIGLVFLFWIIAEVVQKGIGAMNWAFFTEVPPCPLDDGGGVANAIFGTFIITLFATLMGVPIGLMAGIYLSEYGTNSRIGNSIRFAINVMMGIPSIIIGLFVYTLVVISYGFSSIAGAISLAIIMLPVIARTAEDMLSLVPGELRESGLALGAPRWKVTLGIIFRSSKSGLITGTLLAVARVSGETAPLYFTAFNNSRSWSIDGPTANLTVTIFQSATETIENWEQLGWGAALFIMISVLSLNIISRFLIKEKKK